MKVMSIKEFFMRPGRYFVKKYPSNVVNYEKLCNGCKEEVQKQLEENAVSFWAFIFWIIILMLFGTVASYFYEVLI